MTPTPRATSHEDLRTVSRQIQQLTIQQKRWLGANVVLRNLMVVPELTEMIRTLTLSPNIPQQMVDDGIMKMFLELLPEEDVNEFVDGTCQHILTGTDETSDASVGGFNQVELDALVEILSRAETIND